MLEEDLEVAIKVVVVGNGAVGKSSMIQRYCKGVFTHDYKKTIGVDFLERQIVTDGEDVRLMLWDTAGQEEFDTITKAYYRGAQACVLAFSTVDRASFEAVESWKHKVEDEVGQVVTVLVQNKIDLIEESVVTAEEVEELAKRLKLKKVYRTSVKENFNVEEVFQYLAHKYIERRNKDHKQQLQQQQQPSSASLGIFQGKPDQPKPVTNGTTPNSPSTSAATNGQAFKLKPDKKPKKRSKKLPICSLL